MATGNLILGTARKKLGDVVLYRSGGEQRSRVRVTPKNPKSAKQAVQRMVLATAAKMASAYEPLVNHSFENTEVGAKSLQEFRKYAMYALRSAAADALANPGGDYIKADFDIKGAPCIGALDGLQISRGSLGYNAFSKSGDTLNIVLQSALATTAFTTQEAYVAELRKLGIEPGDQLTFVMQGVNPNVSVASAEFGGESVANYAQIVRYSRITFVTEIPDGFSGTLLDEDQINPALIQDAEGITPDFSSTGTTLTADYSSVIENGYEVQLAGYIRSKLVDGKYKYSTCMLDSDTTGHGKLDYNNAALVYTTYMDGVATIDVGEKLYLRHAVAAPFGVGE